MRRSAWILICIALAAAGCTKKSSPEFYDAQGRYSVVLSRLGDDAYADPEMDAIVELLASVPANAKEKDQANGLSATIAGERARIEREAAEQEAAIDRAGNLSPPGPGLGDFPAVQPIEDTPGEAVDAGPPPAPRPVAGMAEADFQAKFGSCMEGATPLAVPGTTGTVYMVRDTPECQKKYGSPGAKIGYVFNDGKLNGTVARSVTKQTVIIDAGVRPVVTGTIDAGVVFLVPGQPFPPGYVPYPGADDAGAAP